MDKCAVLCAGCSCLDLFLLRCDDLPVRDGLALVGGIRSIPGCSTSNTGRSLAELGVPIEILTLIGNDSNGDSLLGMWKNFGIGTKFVRRTSEAPTALSVLPVYHDGKRGIYFCSGTNSIVDSDKLLGDNLIEGIKAIREQFPFRVFHFGYPTLMPNLQAEPLAELFDAIRKASNNEAFISLDTTSLHDHQKHLAILAPSLRHVAVFKCNIEEAAAITGKMELINRVKTCSDTSASVEDLVAPDEVRDVANSLLKLGPGIACISLGSNGAFVMTADSVTLADRFGDFYKNLSQSDQWSSKGMFVPPFCPSGPVNATGAGDAFIAGFLAALLHDSLRQKGLETIIKVAHATALQRIEDERIKETLSLDRLVDEMTKFKVLEPKAFFEFIITFICIERKVFTPSSRPSWQLGPSWRPSNQPCCASWRNVGFSRTWAPFRLLKSSSVSLAWRCHSCGPWRLGCVRYGSLTWPFVINSSEPGVKRGPYSALIPVSYTHLTLPTILRV
eukprot:TRINITY_DN139_c0_g1_i2.p1 TRINITY_DN139_c0_g1~~TRINITY_DN139_c0_g1_i2.p1  ORF type:complete len:503 (-),score=47.17 TRINITY_DN139_c0_g1_i2:16-1524(-)